MYELFTPDVLLEGIHGVYADRFACYCEERGYSFGPGTDIYYAIEHSPQAEALRRIAAYWLGEIERVWGASLRLVFHHGGIPEEKFGDALHYTFMGCVGHGVSLDDEYGDELDLAGKVLGKSFSTHGLYLDDSDVMWIAEEDAEAFLESVGHEYEEPADA